MSTRLFRAKLHRCFPQSSRERGETNAHGICLSFDSPRSFSRVPSPTSESEPSIAVPPFALDHSRHVTIDSASPWNFSQHSSSMMVTSHDHLSSTLTLARQAQVNLLQRIDLFTRTDRKEHSDNELRFLSFKSLLIKTDDLEFPRQRSYSNMSISSSRLSTASTEANVPLKKRLLHAYINEQRPNSPF